METDDRAVNGRLLRQGEALLRCLGYAVGQIKHDDTARGKQTVGWIANELRRAGLFRVAEQVMAAPAAEGERAVSIIVPGDVR